MSNAIHEQNIERKYLPAIQLQRRLIEAYVKGQDASKRSLAAMDLDCVRSSKSQLRAPSLVTYDLMTPKLLRKGGLSPLACCSFCGEVN